MRNASATVPPALQARSRVTQDRIFAAGVRLLEDGGPDALTVAAVAAAAGVAVGSVYRRFGDKDRLLGAIQTRCTEDFRAEFRQRIADTAVTTSTPPVDVITAAVTAVAGTLSAHAPLVRVFVLLGTDDPAVYDVGAKSNIDASKTFRDTLMLAAPALRHHPDVEAAIDFAHRLTFGMCLHRIVHGEAYESTRPLSWAELTDHLCRAVTAYLLGSAATD